MTGSVVVPVTTDWTDVSVTVWHGMAHWPDNPPVLAILGPLGGQCPVRAAHVEAAP
jgi:hypothetical protein